MIVFLAGANCPDGSAFVPAVNGSNWLIHDSIGSGQLYRLRSCPPGYIMSMDYSFPDQDRCIECESGKYSLVEATNISTVCRACPIGGSCPGGSTVDSIEGYWKQEYSEFVETTNLGVVRVFKCAPGTHLFRGSNVSIFSHIAFGVVVISD